MDFTQRRIVQRKVEVVLLQNVPGGALDRAVANVVKSMGAITGPDNLEVMGCEFDPARRKRRKAN